MICLYDSKETNFNHNGLVVLSDCKSFSTIEKLNDSYEVEFEYPLDANGKWQHIVEDNIIKNNDGQLFRIYRKVKTLDGIKINARHIFYDLIDNFLEDLTLTNQNGSGSLNSILTNTQYPHPFTSMSDVASTFTKAYSLKNPVEVILGDDGVIANLGGEIVRDNFTVKLLQARGADRGVLVSYGKNIVGIEETIDLNSVITRIYPTGKDSLTIPEKYVDSPNINNYPHPKVKEISFPDIDNADNLRTAAQLYYSLTNCDVPNANYKVDFIELTKTEEYKNYSVLESVYMGDTVIVRHSKLNIDLQCKVISITKNDLTKKIEKVELGNFRPNLGTGISNTITSVNKNIQNTKSSLQIAIDNATAQMNSALGGYVVKRNGELLIMDTEDVNTATRVWRWNQNGLGYSSTGYAGPYGLAMTADGRIVADFITTGTLDASLLKVLNLVVGNNVTMGPGAVITWDKTGTSGVVPPTASDVDARPSTWTPTAADVGARPNTWMPNAAQVGALATNWVGTTNIDAYGIYTGTLNANQINAGTISGSRLYGITVSAMSLIGPTADLLNVGSDNAVIDTTIDGSGKHAIRIKPGGAGTRGYIQVLDDGTVWFYDSSGSGVPYASVRADGFYVGGTKVGASGQTAVFA